MRIRFFSIFLCCVALLFSALLWARSEFVFKVQGDAPSRQLSVHIAPLHYLYKDKLTITAVGASVDEVHLPSGEVVDDPLFGLTEVYTQEVSIPFTLDLDADNATDMILYVSYQGCTEQLCYPPETISFALTADKTEFLPWTSDVESDLKEQGISLWMLLAYLGLGVGIAFTPCLYPMYPILLGSLARQQQDRRFSFRYTFWYVQGLALTYSALGFLVASVGVQLQIYLQHPVLLIGLSLLFVAMSASLLGWFRFQLPDAWTQRVTHISHHFENKGSLGACAMGALAGFICSPCTTAPLSAALLYIAQTGNQILGVLSLYFLSLGMGIPLLLMGLGYQKLPHSGPWLTMMPKLLGLALLVMPVNLLSRFLSDRWIYILMLVLMTFIFFYLWRHLALRAKTLRVQALLGGVLTCLWLSVSLHQAIIPLQAEQKQDVFITLNTAQELDAYLKQAAVKKQQVILDFTADWCSACHKMEKETFNHVKVRDYLQQTVAVRIDLSQSSKPVKDILNKYEIKGIPAILVFAPDNPEPTQRIVGQQSADVLLTLLQNAGK